MIHYEHFFQVVLLILWANSACLQVSLTLTFPYENAMVESFGLPKNFAVFKKN